MVMGRGLGFGATGTLLVLSRNIREDAQRDSGD